MIQIQEKLKEKNAKIIQLEENKEKTLDDIFPNVPASCYVDLLYSLSPESYEGNKTKIFLIICLEIF